MAQLDDSLNYLTNENGAQIVQVSSYNPNCPASNLFDLDTKQLWLSEEGLPQFFIIDISNLLERPKYFKSIGFYCWHDYNSNPQKIEIQVSTDGQQFITWTVLQCELRQGLQMFSMDPLSERYKYIKFIIRETFGAAKTYLNSVYIFEENPFQSNKALPSYSQSQIMETIQTNISHDDKSIQKLNIPKPNHERLSFQNNFNRKNSYSNIHEQQGNLSSASSEKNILQNQKESERRPQQYNPQQKLQNLIETSSFMEQKNELKHRITNMDYEINNLVQNVKHIQNENSPPQMFQKQPLKQYFQSPPQPQEQQQDIYFDGNGLLYTQAEKDVVFLKQQHQNIVQDIKQLSSSCTGIESLIMKIQQNLEIIVEKIQDLQEKPCYQRDNTVKEFVGYNSNGPQQNQQRFVQSNNNLELIERKVADILDQRLQKIEQNMLNTLNKKLHQQNYKPSPEEQEPYPQPKVQNQKLSAKKNEDILNYQNQLKQSEDSSPEQVWQQHKQHKKNKELIKDIKSKNMNKNSSVTQLKQAQIEENDLRDQIGKIQQQKSNNPRVIMLLEKLQEKLQLRQQKVELLKVQNDSQLSNSEEDSIGYSNQKFSNHNLKYISRDERDEDYDQ